VFGWKMVKVDGSVVDISEPVLDELWRIYKLFKS